MPKTGLDAMTVVDNSKAKKKTVVLEKLKLFFEKYLGV